jgi:hypothetical protein
MNVTTVHVVSTTLTGKVVGAPVYLSEGLGLITVEIDGRSKKDIAAAIIRLDRSIVAGDKVVLKSFTASPGNNFSDQFRIAEKAP